MPLFWTDSIVLSCSDVNAAKQWWVTAFDCKEVAVPPDWDEPLPSDVALKLPGSDVPTVLLSSNSEGRESSEHPIIFTGKVKKAHEHLRGRGIVSGPIREEFGTEIFEVTDPEGNAIEICNEP
jgi:catechol 2,3-dioxygenase-like lactoylglutathione lyase family enzyme